MMTTILKCMVLSLILFGCQSKNNNVTDGIISRTNVLNVEDIYGTWYYTPYTDSILKYKEIYDITFDESNYIDWYGFKITIIKEKPDSIFTRGVGSGDWKFHVIKSKEYEYQVNSEWFKSLVFNKENGQLVLNVEVTEELKSRHKTELKKFKFYKKELEIKDEWSYFSMNLFKGDYLNTIDKSNVIIGDNTVAGLGSYKKYDISTDFVDSWNFDNIVLFTSDSTWKNFNWQFKGDTLFINEIIDHFDGINEYPISSEIGKTIYKLIKKH